MSIATEGVGSNYCKEVTDMVDEGTKITIRMSNADIQLMEDFMSDHDLENRSVFIRDAIREYIANNKAEAQSDDNSVTVRLNPVVLQTLENMRADGTIYGHEGKVTKMSGVIDPATGSIQVIAVFPNPERILKSGGSGAIIIPKSNSDAIVIPQGCVSEVQNKKFVYTLGKDNKVKYTEIKVDPQTDGNNYVVTDGLKVGDKYVTNGITKLTDGMEIVPITPERYQQKIQEQAKAMSAGDIVDAMK